MVPRNPALRPNIAEKPITSPINTTHLPKTPNLATSSYESDQKPQRKGFFSSLLRYYFSGDYDALRLAVGMAEAYSARICERTGAPGDLMKTTSNFPYFATLSSSGIEQWIADFGERREFQRIAKDLRDDVTSGADEEKDQLPGTDVRAKWTQSEAIDVLKRRHDHVFADGCVIDIPKGGFDLADAVAAQIGPWSHQGARTLPAAVPKISRMIWSSDFEFSVAIDESSIVRAALDEMNYRAKYRRLEEPTHLELEIARLRRSLAVACLFAANMSRRMDPETGRTGPVDDVGRLII